MTVRSDIQSMYSGIVEGLGDFGDGIETGSIRPYEMLTDRCLGDDERNGVGVALLCYIMTAIDNATYEDALSGPDGRRVRLLLRDNSFETMPWLTRALHAFLESEDAFVSNLSEVYRFIVVPEFARIKQGSSDE